MDTFSTIPFGDWAGGSAGLLVRRFAASKEEIGHLAWYAKSIEAFRDANLPHLGGRVYLDYAGAALYSKVQAQAVNALLLENFFCNPHTDHATGEAIEQVREQVLEMFGTSSSTHTLAFTSGSTQALSLIGESFAWSSGGCFVYAQENHTSTVGLRQLAQRAGTPTGFFDLDDLSSLHDGLSAVSPLAGSSAAWPASGAVPAGYNLLAIPGESNFSGVRADLSCIESLRRGPMRWRVLLDSAKLACCPGALDLGACPADFAVVSFYKIFGLPTGLGALIVRHDAVPLLAPHATCGGASNSGGAAYFAGGGVASVSATSNFVVPRPNLSEWFERGTCNFQAILSLPSQITAHRQLGPDIVRHRHAQAVCHEAYLRMQKLRHANGRPLCAVFGRHEDSHWHVKQGPTIACVLHYADGTPVSYALVGTMASDRGILLRTGCHCNAGACQRYLGITDEDIRHFFSSGKVCGDDLGIIDGRATGVIRVSFGLYSTLADVHAWLQLLEEFVNELPKADIECEVCSQGKAVATVKIDPHAPLTRPPRPSGETVTTAGVERDSPMVAPAAALAATVFETTGNVVGLKVYPIKGCGPLRVRKWPIDPATGVLLLDRRWCVAPDDGREVARIRPVNTKQAPRLSQVRFSLRRASGLNGTQGDMALVLSARDCPDTTVLPLTRLDAELLRRCGAEAEESEQEDAVAIPEHPTADAGLWFERLVGLQQLRLVEAGQSPGTGEAPSNAHFANAPNTLLMMSTASLREFGRLVGLEVTADRFRANLEVDIEPAFAEMEWPIGSPVKVGDAEFEAAGRCVRCHAIDINPEEGKATGPSVLAALATSQRGEGKGPTFGVLLRPRQSGSSLPQALTLAAGAGIRAVEKQ